MAVGDSKKIKFDQSLEKLNVESESTQTIKEDVVLLYKDNNHGIIKELRFESKMKNSKLT